MKVELSGAVSNIMVVGDKRKFLACLLTLKTDPLPGEPMEGQYSLSGKPYFFVLFVLEVYVV